MVGYMDALLTQGTLEEPSLMDFEHLHAYVTENNQEAFTHLVERYSALVYGTCLRRLKDPHLAEDATQAVFVVLSVKAKSIKEDQLLASWLCKTAKYVCANIKKTQAREGQKLKRYEEVSLTKEENPKFSTLNNHIEEALEKLPSKNRDAVYLHYFMGHTQAEVAKAVGAKEDAVRKRIKKGLEDIRKHLSRMSVAVSFGTLEEYLKATSEIDLPKNLFEQIKTLIDKPHQEQTLLYQTVSATLKNHQISKLKITALVLIPLVVLGVSFHSKVGGFFFPEAPTPELSPPSKELRFSSLTFPPEFLGKNWKRSKNALVLDDWSHLSTLPKEKQKALKAIMPSYKKLGVIGLGDFTWTRSKPTLNTVTIKVFKFENEKKCLAWINKKYQHKGWEKFYKKRNLRYPAFDSTQINKTIIAQGKYWITAHQIGKTKEHIKALNHVISQLGLKTLPN